MQIFFPEATNLDAHLIAVSLISANRPDRRDVGHPAQAADQFLRNHRVVFLLKKQAESD
jgi:hypothetical protein